MNGKAKVVAMLCCLVFWVNGAEQSEFDAYKSQTLLEQAAFNAQQQAEYEAFKQSFRAQLEAYKKRIRKKWGYAEHNTATKMVIYSADLNHKVVVDYQTDEIRVSLGPDTAHDGSKIQQLLRTTLQTPVQQLAKQSQIGITKSIGQPELDQSITLADSLGIEAPDIERMTNNITQSSALVLGYKMVIGVVDDLGKDIRQIEKTQIGKTASEQLYIKKLAEQKRDYQYMLNLSTFDPRLKKTKTRKVDIGESRWKKAQIYAAQIKYQSEKYRLSPALLYAIMETESSFNPVAQSAIPAFGLMLVAPAYGGLEANLFLRKRHEKPSPQQLFIANVNIIFGTAYVHLLSDRDFAQIKNQTSRLYCVVAAYNSGIGKVTASFNGQNNKSLKSAIAQINKMAPEAVLKKLSSTLSQGQTATYLKNVLQAAHFYEQKIKTAW